MLKYHLLYITLLKVFKIVHINAASGRYRSTSQAWNHIDSSVIINKAIRKDISKWKHILSIYLYISRAQHLLVFQHFLHITHHFCLSFVTTHPTHGMVIVKGMLCWQIISCTNKKKKEEKNRIQERPQWNSWCLNSWCGRVFSNEKAHCLT